MTGLLPAIPIALLLPFVPESRVWQERKRAGTLKRRALARCSRRNCAASRS